MIVKVNKEGRVFWQEPKDAETVGEPAILLKRYSDCLCLQQEAQCITITLSCVEEFIKAIRETMKVEK